MHEEIQGIVPPMVTPFRRDASIDEDLLRAETRYLIEIAAATKLPVMIYNVVPWTYLLAGDHRKGRELHEKLLPIWNAICGDNLPANTRYCMELQGRHGGVPRPPMPATSDRLKKPLRTTDVMCTLVALSRSVGMSS